MPIQVIFFDLGNTLIYPKEPWQPIFVRADAAMLKVLRDAGIHLDSPTFPDDFETFLDSYYAAREDDLVERTTHAALRDLLAQKGYTSVPDPILRAALDAMYVITRSNWQAEDDAIPTLTTLREREYRLGMISNASDDQNVQQQIDQWGFRPYFDFVITSAACGIRKPHPRIFQIALDHFHVPPDRAAMVGDTLSADVLGANRMGMVSVWVTRRAAAGSNPSIPLRAQAGSPVPAALAQAEQDPAIQPKAIINTLSELPSLFDRLQNAIS